MHLLQQLRSCPKWQSWLFYSRVPLLCIHTHNQVLLYTSTSNTLHFRGFILAYKRSESSNRCAYHVLLRKNTLSTWKKRNKVLKIPQIRMLNAETEVTALFAIVIWSSQSPPTFSQEVTRRKWPPQALGWGVLITVLTNVPMAKGLVDMLCYRTCHSHCSQALT